MPDTETPIEGAEGTEERGGLARAIASASLGILSCNRDSSSVVFVNAPGVAVLRSLAAATGADATTMLVRAALAAEATAGQGAPGRPHSLGIRGRILGYSLYPAPDVLWVFFRDVTEKVRLDEVAGSRQVADSLLGVFSALRHELGNPVNTAKTALAVLRNRLGRLDEEAVRRYVDRALESLAGVESVLGTLRDYGFVTEPQPRSVRVAEIVERAVLECGPCLLVSGVTLTVDAGAEVLDVVADPSAAEQAVCALLQRAARSATAGTPHEIALTVEGQPETVSIRVSTAGVRRAEEHDEGTDLSLLVVRRLSALMGATLELDGAEAILVLQRAETGH